MTRQDFLDRIEELRTLKDGWHDGIGMGLPGDGLDWLAAQVDKIAKLPYVFPCLEGEVLFEWFTTGSPTLQINLKTKIGDYHAFKNGDSDDVAEFDLSGDEGWEKLRAKLDFEKS